MGVSVPAKFSEVAHLSDVDSRPATFRPIPFTVRLPLETSTVVPSLLATIEGMGQRGRSEFRSHSVTIHDSFVPRATTSSHGDVGSYAAILVDIEFLPFHPDDKN